MQQLIIKAIQHNNFTQPSVIANFPVLTNISFSRKMTVAKIFLVAGFALNDAVTLNQEKNSLYEEASDQIVH